MPQPGVIDNELQPNEPLGDIENYMIPSDTGTSCTFQAGVGDILRVKEINDGRSGTEGPNKSKRYIRRYNVITKTASVTAHTVVNAPELPAYGEAYVISQPVGPPVVDDTVGVIEKTAQIFREESYNVWHVTIVYDSEGSPLLIPWEVHWGAARYTKPATREIDDPPDYYADPVANSAGDPFDPPVEDDASRSVLTITRNRAVFSPLRADKFRDSVNDAIIVIDEISFAAETLKCVGLEGTRFKVGDVNYWRETLVIEVNKTDTWKKRVIDRGFNRKDGTKKVVITDPAGKPYPTASFLDGSGNRLPDGDPAVILEFQTLPRHDFSELDLDYSSH